MEKKVVIIDTSILCAWLKVPGKETCGTGSNKWDHERAQRKIDQEIADGSLLVMPVTTVVESGNHIAQSHGDRHALVNKFADHIENALAGSSPWTEFGQQSQLLSGEGMHKMLEKWRGTAVAGQSLGDALIVETAEFYCGIGAKVEILTGDAGLKAYEPKTRPTRTPRRRQR